jgi:peptidoglycan/LPS O-acetylase OafA/YrhL
MVMEVRLHIFNLAHSILAILVIFVYINETIKLGIVNRILSNKVYIPFTRLSYCAYLIHPPMMTCFYFAQRSLATGTELTLVSKL